MSNSIAKTDSHRSITITISALASSGNALSNTEGEGVAGNEIASFLKKIQTSLEECESTLAAIEASHRPATPEEIEYELSKMMAGYLGHGNGDMKGFGATMMIHILNLNPSIVALQKGCESVMVEVSRFPSVATVYQAILKVDSEIDELRATVKRLAGSKRRLLIAKAEFDEARAREARAAIRSDCMAALRAGGDVSRFDSEMVEGCRRMLARLAQETA